MASQNDQLSDVLNRAISFKVDHDNYNRTLTPEEMSQVLGSANYMRRCAEAFLLLGTDNIRPSEWSENMKNLFSMGISQLENLNKLDIRNPNAAAVKQQSVSSIKDWPTSNKDFLDTNVLRALIMLAPLSDSSELEGITEITGRARDLADQLTNMLADADELNRILKDKTKSNTITAQAKVFEDQVKEDHKKARNALIASALIAVIMIAFLLSDPFMDRNPDSSTRDSSSRQQGTELPADKEISNQPSMTYLYIHYGVNKGAVIILLLTGVVYALRIFTAMRHNAIVNQHRKNALDAYDAFVASTKDDNIRSTVLLECTRAIYSPQPTGLSRNLPDQGGDVAGAGIFGTLLRRD